MASNPDNAPCVLGPLEREIADILEKPLLSTPFGLAEQFGDEFERLETFIGLDADQRFEMILLCLAGNANALRRIARHIDEADGTPPGRASDD